MEKGGVRQLISLDFNRPIREQYNVLHNRWHPDIPTVATVKPGEAFRVQCTEWTGEIPFFHPFRQFCRFF